MKNGRPPRNVIFIIADSLRFDTVYRSPSLMMPYLEKNAVSFVNARANACWTLPSTASFFSGQLPHEHGATSQTRQINRTTPLLAGLLKQKGYRTVQVTANAATTEIFGLNRGFDQVLKVWDFVKPAFPFLINLLLLSGKPRIRKHLFSMDLVAGKFAEDLRAGNGWLQTTYEKIFELSREVLGENRNEGKTFLFINLMETHFPFHIRQTFGLSAKKTGEKLRELKGLFNMIDQTFLKKERGLPDAKTLELLRERQLKAWNILRTPIDEFIAWAHGQGDNLVVFAGDHGENFGDNNWLYHFSNLNEACLRVPLFWLDDKIYLRNELDHPVSLKDLYGSILRRCMPELRDSYPSVFDQGGVPASETYWYNNQGNTLEKYRVNQFCFVAPDGKFLNKGNRWYKCGEKDPAHPFYFTDHFEEAGLSDEAVLSSSGLDSGQRKYIKEKLQGFRDFSNVLPK